MKVLADIATMLRAVEACSAALTTFLRARNELTDAIAALPDAHRPAVVAEVGDEVMNWLTSGLAARAEVPALSPPPFIPVHRPGQRPAAARRSVERGTGARAALNKILSETPDGLTLEELDAALIGNFRTVNPNPKTALRVALYTMQSFGVIARDLRTKKYKMVPPARQQEGAH